MPVVEEMQHFEHFRRWFHPQNGPRTSLVTQTLEFATSVNNAVTRDNLRGSK